MNGVELAKALSGSALHHALQDVFGGSVMLREGGNFDIWIGQTIGILWLSCDTISDTVKERLKQLSKANVKRIVMLESMECGDSSSSLHELQMYVCVELRLQLAIVASSSHAAVFVKELVRQHNEPGPCTQSSSPASQHDSIYNTVLTLPNTGPATAVTLINNFKSLAGIAGASHQDLALAVGTKTANSITSYLNRIVD